MDGSQHTTEKSFGLESGKPNQHLLSYLEVKSETFSDPRPRWLMHYRGQAPISKPFDVGEKVVSFAVPLRVQNKWFSYTWKAALYFMARNSLPIWYQLEFTIGINTMQLVDKQEQLTSPHETFRVRRLTTERPIIAWEEIKAA